MTAIRESFQVFIKAELSEEANTKRLVDAAKAGLADTLASRRASPSYYTVVDGVKDSSVDTAKKSIVYNFIYGAEIIAFALSFLDARSPHRTGEFAKSFWISVDGKFYSPNQFDPQQGGAFQEIIIGNTQPQNRRIDIQLDGNRQLHFSTPAGLYDDCVRALKRQFGKLINAKRLFDYSFPGKYHVVHTNIRFQSPAVLITPFN